MANIYWQHFKKCSRTIRPVSFILSTKFLWIEGMNKGPRLFARGKKKFHQSAFKIMAMFKFVCYYGIFFKWAMSKSRYRIRKSACLFDQIFSDSYACLKSWDTFIKWTKFIRDIVNNYVTQWVKYCSVLRNNWPDAYFFYGIVRLINDAPVYSVDWFPS